MITNCERLVCLLVYSDNDKELGGGACDKRGVTWLGEGQCAEQQH